MEVKVLDALMGSGKPQRLISDVSKITNPVIYITTLSLECHRFDDTFYYIGVICAETMFFLQQKQSLTSIFLIYTINIRNACKMPKVWYYMFLN